jgi:serine/threonine protein kinase
MDGKLAEFPLRHALPIAMIIRFIASCSSSTLKKFVHCKCRLCKNVVTLEEEIGSGGFGKVYRALFNDEVCVVKTLQIDNINDIQDAFDEAAHVVKLRHPNVVAYKDVFFHRNADTGRDFVCIVMEFCDKGSLYDIVVNDGLNFNQFCNAIKQICQGLAFIHSENVLHCDVKLDNIFVISGKDGDSFKLGDFGLATRLKHFTQNETLNSRENNSKHVPGFISTIGGTPCYQAPELFENDRIISPPADLWGVGCLIYEAGTGLDVPDDEPYLGQRALHNTWNVERDELIQNLKSGLLRMCCQGQEHNTVRTELSNLGQFIQRPHSVPSTRLNVAQSGDIMPKKLTQDDGNRQSFESRKRKDKEDQTHT